MSSRSRTAGRWLACTAACGALAGGTAAQPPELQSPILPQVEVINPPSATPGAAETLAAACPDPFAKVPPVRPFPRPGFFPIPPTGPGYYSLLDAAAGNGLKGPPKYPYPRFGLMPPSFFDADFRYLDDPKNAEFDFFDPLKRIRVGDDFLFSTGGQVSTRYMNESDSRLLRRDNVYDLSRVRAYTDLWYRDVFRVYAEFVGAYTAWQDLPPLAIDEDRADFQNLFVDVKAGEIEGKPVYVRAGRQELLYGSQRLISPPPWANTRRTFQGVKAFRPGETVDVDLFWVQPVTPNPGRLNSVDNNQNFAGAWVTYRPQKGRAADAYYLMLDNTNSVVQQGLQRGRFTVHTVGGRYVGDRDGALLWDIEGAVQFGSHAVRDVFAGMGTAGVGYHWKDAPLTPTVWGYYDYASGDDDPAGGAHHTFHQLFPFGHYYMGWVDNIGRQNVHDLNAHLYLYPAKWVQLQLQYHSFWVAARRDALYNDGGAAIRRDPTGRSGSHVGHEIDAILNVHLSKHADLLTGYAHLWGGEFLRGTAGANGSKDSGLLWVMLNYRW